MSALEDNLHLKGSADNEKKTSGGMPAIVVISSDKTAENIVATLRDKDNGNSADSISEIQESIEISDLTRDHWLKIL